MLLVQLIQAFLAYVEHERGSLRPSNYERDLQVFLRYVFENPNTTAGFSLLENINSVSYLRRFMASQMLLNDRRTASRILSTLKSFFRYLKSEELISNNAAALVQFPKSLPEKLPRYLRRSEVTAMLELDADTPKALRTRAMAELLYSTGIRVAELHGLTFNHLDFETRTIRIKAKGGRERVVPFGFKAERAMRVYFSTWPERYPREGRAPLWRNGRRRLSLRSIQRAVKKLALDALGEPGRRVTPLALRHTCATHLLNNGASLRGIQELLGHKSVTTTQKYTHLDKARLKEIYRAAHPKEQKQGDRG